MASLKTDKEIIELIDNFFVKSTLLICSSKSNDLNLPIDVHQGAQFDEEWFSSDIYENMNLPDVINKWSTFEGEQDLPPLVIETYLDLRQLTSSNWITLKDDDGNSWNVCKGTKKTEIVLERWLIELDRSSSTFKNHKLTEDDSSNLPRQLVLLFRYLYTLIQILPANDLHLSLVKTFESQGSNQSIFVGTRILDGSRPILSKGRIGLSKPIISTYSNIINESNVPTHLEQRKITPVWTKFGLLRLSVSYRHDCHFKLHNGEEEQAANPSRPDLTLRNSSINRSLSLSPRAHPGSINSIEQQTSQRKPVSISRQLQVFKVGSVTGTPIAQSNTLTRNPSSSSSIVAGLQAQRSSNSLVSGNIQSHSATQDTHIEGMSAGSASKYSSSFGKIRRHSSTKYSDHGEKLAKATKHLETPSEDLLDFVRLLDQKPELQIRKNPAGSMDISSSLLKFQNLKPTNDFISDNLSLSISIDPSHASQRRRSSSHSPIPSFSPTIKYPSIPSRFSQSQLNDSLMTNDRKSSEMNKTSVASYHDSITAGNRLHITSKDSSPFNEGMSENIEKADDHLQEEEEEDDDLLMNDAAMSNSRLKLYNSPRSVDSVSSSIARNRLPIPQPSHYSQPTTTAVPAYAKLHRPGMKHNDTPENQPANNNNPTDVQEEDEDEDEDLLLSLIHI